MLANALHSDGRQHDILYVDGGPSSTRTTGFLRMEGKEVFKQAVVNMAAVVGEVLGKVGLAAKDIDWLVPHQANKRIIDGTGRKLGLPPERVVVTVDQHANTSAASIPLALDAAVKRRPHQAGRSAAAGRHWRRPGLGSVARPLVVTDD